MLDIAGKNKFQLEAVYEGSDDDLINFGAGLLGLQGPMGFMLDADIANEEYVAAIQSTVNHYNIIKSMSTLYLDTDGLQILLRTTLCKMVRVFSCCSLPSLISVPYECHFGILT